MKKFSLVLSILLASNVAYAHPGRPLESFNAGFMHPFTGIDHLLVMLAVGVCAASMQGRSRWQMPVLFVMMMLFGGLLAMLGFSMPMLETGIAASVFAMGILLIIGTTLNKPLQMAFVALFAIYHGLAHGIELQQQQVWLAFSAMLLATSLLHALGYFIAQHRFVIQHQFKKYFAYALMCLGLAFLLT